MPDPIPPMDVCRRGPQMPILARAAILAVCWLPFVAVMMCFIPQFTPIFEKLAEIDKLPTLTGNQLEGHAPSLSVQA